MKIKAERRKHLPRNKRNQQQQQPKPKLRKLKGKMHQRTVKTLATSWIKLEMTKMKRRERKRVRRYVIVSPALRKTVSESPPFLAGEQGQN